MLKRGDVFMFRYEIDDIIGDGASGVVYRAHDRGEDRTVAVKVLHNFHTTMVQRFEREAKVLEALDHPGLVRVYSHGTEADILYMILEYVEGPTLSEAIAEGIDTARGVHVLMSILRALAAAHKAGVLHRDIKPQNIILSPNQKGSFALDTVKIIDFGVAKLVGDVKESMEKFELTQAGAVVGSWRYISPEQVTGVDPVEASDIFSLGLCAYEMFSGDHPLAKCESDFQVAVEVAGANEFRLPPDTNVPDRLRDVINRMLEKDLAKRYESAQEVLADLEDVNDATVINLDAMDLPFLNRGDGPTQPKQASYVSVVGGVQQSDSVIVQDFDTIPDSDETAERKPAVREPPTRPLSDERARRIAFETAEEMLETSPHRLSQSTEAEALDIPATPPTTPRVMQGAPTPIVLAGLVFASILVGALVTFLVSSLL